MKTLKQISLLLFTLFMFFSITIKANAIVSNPTPTKGADPTSEGEYCADYGYDYCPPGMDCIQTGKTWHCRRPDGTLPIPTNSPNFPKPTPTPPFGCLVPFVCYKGLNDPANNGCVPLSSQYDVYTWLQCVNGVPTGASCQANVNQFLENNETDPSRWATDGQCYSSLTQCLQVCTSYCPVARSCPKLACGGGIGGTVPDGACGTITCPNAPPCATPTNTPPPPPSTTPTPTTPPLICQSMTAIDNGDVTFTPQNIKYGDTVIFNARPNNNVQTDMLFRVYVNDILQTQFDKVIRGSLANGVWSNTYSVNVNMYGKYRVMVFSVTAL